MFQSVRLSAVIGIVFFACLSFWPALDEEHSGLAKAIDAGIIEIDGERHRLYGIDALEIGQRCRRRDGAQWPCGREATAALASFLEGRKVNCEIWQGTARDAHGRFLSVCHAGGDDIAVWVARNGWVIADRDANRLYNYRSDEGMARFLRRGIWDGPFEPPAEWRGRQQAGDRP